MFEPVHITLKTGEEATVFAVPAKEATIPPKLLEYMKEVGNAEILDGQTYPQDENETYNTEGFYNWWCSNFCAIMVLGDCDELTENSVFLGTFYVKPNFPYGRSKHICNAGFLVDKNFRGRGIGYELGKVYLKWGPMLGYRYSMFNMVYVTNIGSIKIWDKLGFERIGYIKGAGRLKGYTEYIDAIQFGKEFI